MLKLRNLLMVCVSQWIPIRVWKEVTCLIKKQRLNFNLLLKREKMRLINSSNGKISRVTAIRALMSLIRERMSGKTTIRKSES